jgi:hypothetical protein
MSEKICFKFCKWCKSKNAIQQIITDNKISILILREALIDFKCTCVIDTQYNTIDTESDATDYDDYDSDDSVLE